MQPAHITDTTDYEALLEHVTLVDNSSTVDERQAFIEVSPKGFHLRPPVKPHQNSSPQTHENDLFQTIHMGAAIVDKSRWKLVIDGLVEHPLTITWNQLLKFPKTSITAFRECYGSPIKPPTTNLWRIGNVTWSGVALNLILQLARPRLEAQYVWSDGLDSGSFADIHADRYQKDVPLTKAVSGDVLIAYEMNGHLLGKERGGPVRLIVPGWYGTNSTKWLCRLSLQATRSKSPFTTTLYNEIDPTDPKKQKIRPCWDVEPNSFLLTVPSDVGELQGPDVVVSGRAWSALGIKTVVVSVLNQQEEWIECATITLDARNAYQWQLFEVIIKLRPGKHRIMAKATDVSGATQPISGRRNHVHQIEISVKA